MKIDEIAEKGHLAEILGKNNNDHLYAPGKRILKRSKLAQKRELNRTRLRILKRINIITHNTISTNTFLLFGSMLANALKQLTALKSAYPAPFRGIPIITGH